MHICMYVYWPHACIQCANCTCSLYSHVRSLFISNSDVSNGNFHLLCRSVHILIIDTLHSFSYGTLIMSYESVDVHEGFYMHPPFFSHDLIMT